MSLRFRLNLLVTFLSLAFVIVVGTVLVNDTRVSIREQEEAAMRVTIQLLDNVILNSTLNPSLGPTHLVMQGFLRNLGGVRSSHIELYDHVDNLLYVSPESKFMREVKPPKLFVKLVSPKPELIARKIHYGTLLVRSHPDGSVREAWSSFRQVMLIGLLFFVLLNVFVYAFLSHALRPVQHILDAIQRVEKGDLSIKLQQFNLPEFNKIGQSLNRMVLALDAERQLEENRQLTQLIQTHIEDERRSLARELHDELGQYVTVIKTFAVGIGNQAKQQGLDVIEKNAAVIASSANQIYDGMHNIIRQLRPGSLDNLGISETLKDLVSVYQKQHPSVDIVFEMPEPINHVSESISINLYRIVQEAVNNALKYAQANEIKVSLHQQRINDNDLIVMIIEDDGVGMDLEKVDQNKHFGLLGMKERVQGLEGSFSLRSNEQDGMQGTRIQIMIPMQIES